MDKKNIAIVTGGNSGESGISVKSGEVIKKHIDPEKYDAYPVLIHQKEWYHMTADGTRIPVDKNNFSLRIGGRIIAFDCVFIAIHGTPGEDGRLQGYFDLLGLPYTSCDQVTSALTFNKFFCNRLVASWGIPVSKSLHFFRKDKISEDLILKELQLPVFVKPCESGSSIGVTRVDTPEGLGAAIENAFACDDEILVEQGLEGREITCGIIESGGIMTVFPLTEIVSRKSFFDFEAKYDPALCDEIVPAPVSEEVELDCKAISADLYHKLNCKGLVRFDYILTGKKLYFLEVNTVPGLTEESIVPKMAGAMGITTRELFTMMIEEALTR